MAMNPTFWNMLDSSIPRVQIQNLLIWTTKPGQRSKEHIHHKIHLVTSSRVLYKYPVPTIFFLWLIPSIVLSIYVLLRSKYLSSLESNSRDSSLEDLPQNLYSPTFPSKKPIRFICITRGSRKYLSRIVFENADHFSKKIRFGTLFSRQKGSVTFAIWWSGGN